MEKALLNKQVFLSYAFTDRDLVQTTIRKLQKQGVLENETLENIDSAQTITFGDDIRQGIIDLMFRRNLASPTLH